MEKKYEFGEVLLKVVEPKSKTQIILKHFEEDSEVIKTMKVFLRNGYEVSIGFAE